MSQPIIELRGLTKRFEGADSVLALDHIDLTVEQGQIYGIIGLSGAGKSTLVRCINLLEKPTEGTVTVEGRELTALTEKELRSVRKSIGMIFQHFNLLMQRTCLQNITFPLELVGTPKKEAEQRARALLKIVDLESKADAYPAQLSGGQKQRIAIARTLATDPKLLLCDEATSALDPKTTRDILRLIQDINHRLGITVVIITHDMKVIEEICTHVAILDHGHLVERGTVEEVFSRPQSEAGRRLVYPDGVPLELLAQGPRHPRSLQRRHGLPASDRVPGHGLRRPGEHPGRGHPEHRRQGLRHHAPGPPRGPGPGPEGRQLHRGPEEYHHGGGAGLPCRHS